MNSKKKFQPKRHRSAILVFSISLSIISACSSKESKQEIIIPTPVTQVINENDLPNVPVTINLLVGVWKYSEVRTDYKTVGTQPIGEVLLGFTEKSEFSFATNGKKELAENLKSMPTNFTINGSALCPIDKISESDFKINFNNKEAKVYLLNENELVIGKGISEHNKPILYMYFTRIK